jgi:type IV pilus assembly protein PilW
LTNIDGSEAPIRKYVVHVYFVAPCSVGSGSATVNGVAIPGICQAGDDGIPTLKRLELTAKSGATTMDLVPLVEGIEYMKVEFGIDNLPVAISPVTGLVGDSVVDSYTAAPADFSQVIAAKVYLLARNTLPTSGHVDDKSYVLGSVTVAPANYAGNERFRRHAYTASVKLTNVTGRREIP